MSLIDLYEAYHIPYATEGDKHVSKGWVGVACPFCVGGTSGFHLGANLQSWGFSCWKCGKHRTTEAIATILGVPEQEARRLIGRYKESSGSGFDLRQEAANKRIGEKPLKLPTMLDSLSQGAITYLQGRGYDPDKLIRDWDIRCTAPMALLDKISYKFRILCPIYWNGRMVSFQCRDYTGKSDRKYMACPPEREIMSHKSILYGNQKHWEDVAICVEGVTDVWRLGPKSFATMGIKYTLEQVVHIVDHFKRVVVLFDSDPAAQKQAKELAAKIRACGVQSAVERLVSGDPGEMPQPEADYLVKQLTRRVL